MFNVVGSCVRRGKSERQSLQLPSAYMTPLALELIAVPFTLRIPNDMIAQVMSGNVELRST